MKDLIFITAYCPTEEQEKTLEKCVNSVLECGKHIALISHSHIPIHIQKKCHYYVYDYHNDISEDHNLLGFHSYSIHGGKIQSIFFNKVFYGFAIYRMMAMASQIAINFGYKNLHYIEYDCELLDGTLIDENSNHLKEYDSVIHTTNGKEDGMLFGAFSSFKVSSLPENFKNYNKDYISNLMSGIWPKHLETLTKNLFINSGKVLFLNEPSHDRLKRGITLTHRNTHFTLYYNPIDKTLNIFYNSKKDVQEEIVVIINKVGIINIHPKPNHWHIRSLGPLEEINHIRIDNSSNIIYEKTLDDELKNIFKIKSYITAINQ